MPAQRTPFITAKLTAAVSALNEGGTAAPMPAIQTLASTAGSQEKWQDTDKHGRTRIEQAGCGNPC